MLPWWGWVLLWVVLLLGSAVFLGWRAWLVWGQHQGARRARCSGRASSWPSSRARADELRDLEPGP